MSEAIIQALIKALLEHMGSNTNLIWNLDTTNLKTLRIYAFYEFQGYQDPNIEISISADNTDKFSASVSNKHKTITPEIDLSSRRAIDFMNRARKAFDYFIDNNLYYHFINYTPIEHINTVNPVAPSIVFGPFISASEKLSKTQLENLVKNYSWYSAIEDGKLIVSRYTVKRKDINDADNEASNTEILA